MVLGIRTFRISVMPKADEKIWETCDLGLHKFVIFYRETQALKKHFYASCPGVLGMGR